MLTEPFVNHDIDQNPRDDFTVSRPAKSKRRTSADKGEGDESKLDYSRIRECYRIRRYEGCRIGRETVKLSHRCCPPGQKS
jgi:hypothetical protein